MWKKKRTNQHIVELLVDAEIIKQELLVELFAESNELVAITVASIRTVREKNSKSKQKKPGDNDLNADF